MLYSIFGDQQPQTLEELQKAIQELGWSPAICVVELYPPNEEEKDRPHYYGWIAHIYSDGGGELTTCAFPDEVTLRSGLISLGFREIEIGQPLGEEVWQS